MDWVYLMIGIGLLLSGAEGFVRGAANLARLMGISTLVIGLTVVAFGTSLPEMVVSVLASAGDQSDIAVGNVVGSNCFNLMFILGAAAVVRATPIASQLLKMDIPLMILASVVGIIFAIDGNVSKLEGGILVASLVAYTALLIYLASREHVLKSGPGDASNDLSEIIGPDAVAPERSARRIVIDLLWLLGGLGLLILGGDLLVDAGTAIARGYGMSEIVIGVTIIAAGTSMPEVATSLVAAVRGEREIAVGNVIGSNIFNILGVMGSAALVAPKGLGIASSVANVDVWVMLAVSILVWVIVLYGRIITRWQGLFLLACYVAYTWSAISRGA